MRIARIEIENHSRIRDLRLDLRGHAVIVGANDVGKSSLLRLLNLVLGSSLGQIYQHLSISDLADPSRPLVCDVVLDSLTDAERTLFPNEIDIDAADHRIESLPIRLTAERDEADNDAVVIRRWFPVAGHDRGATREQLLAFGWRYLSAVRSTGPSQFDGPSSALQTLLRAIDLGAEKGDLTGLLDAFNAKLRDSERLAQLRTEIAAHLSRAMPRSIQQSDLAVRTAADPSDEVLDSVSMFFESDGKHVPLSEQSDGVRQLMAMTLFDLAEGTANIIAVDEPEVHLHPSSQRTVAELFARSKNQRLVVTHSPYIVQRFEPSQVIVVDPDGFCHQVPDDKLSSIEKVRANWWSPRLLEALTARVVVVVEGVSDRILVEGAASAIGLSLDRCGAVVVELDGADKFKHVLKLLGPTGFSVQVLGLVDDAEKNSWFTALGGSPGALLGEKLWVCDPDLEGEYCRVLTGAVVASVLVSAGVCREAGILQSCGVGRIDEVEDLRVATYCREHKTTAASAISAALTPEMVGAMSTISGLLSKLRDLAAT